MMEILTEKPLTIGLAGGLAFALTLMVGLRLGKRSILIAAAVIFAFTCALLIGERLIQTPHEQLRNTLQEIAAAVDDHDLDKLLSYVHSSATDIRDKVRRHYRDYAPQSAAITRFGDVKVISPSEGEVRFNVRVEMPDTTGFAFVIARLQKEGGRWKVASYSAHPPQEGMRREQGGEEEGPQYEY